MKILSAKSIILPTGVLFDKYRFEIYQLKNQGIDFKDILETSVYARNKVDNVHFHRVGINYTPEIAIIEEIDTWLAIESLENDVEETLKTVLRLGIFSYDFIQHAFSRFCPLDEIDDNVYVDDWLGNDIIVYFTQR